MRLNRNTLILMAVLVGISLAAALVLNAPETEPTVATATSEQVALFSDVDAADIATLTITQRTEVVPDPEATEEPEAEAQPEQVTSTVVLERDEEAGWVLNEDESDVAVDGDIEQADIDSVVTTLASLQSSDQFESDDLAQFGLDEAASVVEFSTGDATYVLRVGAQNPQGTRFYAQLNDDATIYLVSNPAQIQTLVGFALEVPVVQLPTPTPAPVLTLPGPLFGGLTQGDFVSFELVDNTTDEALAVSREDASGDWQLESAPEDADGVIEQSLVGIMITNAISLQGVDGLPAENLDALGLDAPAYTMRAERTNGEIITLQIGDQDPTGTRYYTLVNEFDEVAVVAAEEIDLLLSYLEEPPLIAEVGPAAPDESEATDEAESTDGAEATDDNSAETEAEATEEAENESD